MTRQLALFSVPAVPRTRQVHESKPKQQTARGPLTRDEREQEDRAFWAGLCCRIPPPGVPKLWTCFGTKGVRLMCSWCGWSFDRRTGAIKQIVGPPLRACPCCPVEHPELRPSWLPTDEDQGELFEQPSI